MKSKTKKKKLIKQSDNSNEGGTNKVITNTARQHNFKLLEFKV